MLPNCQPECRSRIQNPCRNMSRHCSRFFLHQHHLSSLQHASTHQLKTGEWYTTPSEKYDFVSWDHDIPNIRTLDIKNPCSTQSPTTKWFFVTPFTTTPPHPLPIVAKNGDLRRSGLVVGASNCQAPGNPAAIGSAPQPAATGGWPRSDGPKDRMDRGPGEGRCF